jgi:arylsulfatase A-like enzyme
MARMERAFGALVGLVVACLATAATAEPHNVIIFVADGLRSGVVTPATAPELAAVRDQGVDFRNSHSLYPTVTTVNASAIATSRQIGDTGDFGNTVYVGEPLAGPYGKTSVVALEDNSVLGFMNGRFGGDYLGAPSLMEAARRKGFSTAVIGKLGPAAIQNVISRDGTGTLVIDDGTGSPEDGLPLPTDLVAAIKAAGLPVDTPDRGLNSWPGTYMMAGVRVANVGQQDWFTAVATRVLLPRFKAQAKPFVMVFWSRDPDGTQHNQGDSLNALTPGINGPTSMAAIANASKDLGALRAALREVGLEATTDIFVTADHGFATVSRESKTSGAAKLRFRDVKPGLLPPGFLAIDLAAALHLPLMDGSGLPVDPAQDAWPHRGAMLGDDADHPRVVITANGGSDLIYLPGADAPNTGAKALAARIVAFLTTQDYTGGLFVRDDLGPVPGALPTSRIGLAGDARTPAPAIVVSFRSFSSGCADPELCGVEVADTDMQQGQGIHGSFGRQDTHNFMAAIGPSFRAGFVDPAPVSNADIAVTLADILGLDLKPTARSGRVIREAMAGTDQRSPVAEASSAASSPAANGFTTVLDFQTFDGRTYFDAAGAKGRTLGLKP